MFNIFLSISIRKIAWFVIHNWVIFAVCAFVVCAAMIVWLIREVIKSGEEDEEIDSDKNHSTAQTDQGQHDVLEKTLEPKIVDVPEPAPEMEKIDIPQKAPQQTGSDISEAPAEAETPEVLDEIPEIKEPEPIAETEQIDITEDTFSQQEPETVEESPELDDLDLLDEEIDSQDLEITEEVPEISESDSLDEILADDLPVTVEEPAGPEVAETPIIIPETKDEKLTKKQEKRRAKEEKRRLKAQQKEAKKQKKDKKKGKKSKRRKKAPSFDYNSPELITESDYRLITQRILKIKQKPRSILFAAAARNSFPITIPVNIAIQLAEDKYRCLLIDLDLKRNAIAKAFDIEDKPNPKRLRPMPYPTPIKELFVWPAHNFTRSRHMNIISLVRAAGENFNYVLISAPYFIGSPDRVQIAAAAGFGLIFTQDPIQAELLDTIIELTNCRILAHYQIRS